MQWFQDIKDKILQGASFLLEAGNTLTDHALSIGISKEALALMVIGGGISLLLLLFLIIMLMFRATPTSQQGNPRLGADADDAISLTETTSRTMGAETIAPEEREISEIENSQDELAQIERDMITLRELHDAGRIDASVFLEETRDLYQKAKSLF
ncbi:hypothetical protein AB8880_04985 [Alphaproteobacteria bacterium LSUCC0684]